MVPQMTRHTMLALALALIPGFAAAASQAGDNGRQPVGADNEGPRIAVPNQRLDDDGAWSGYSGSGYYRPYYANNGYYYYVVPGAQAYYYTPPPTTYYRPPPTTYYSPPPYYAYNGPSYTIRNRDEAWAYCDTFPLAERPSCRAALIGP